MRKREAKRVTVTKYKGPLYKCVVSKSLLADTDIIWRDKTVEGEIERFRVNYDRWCKGHPEKIKKTSGRNSRPMTADVYIKKFLLHIDTIISDAEVLNWPWEWCIDDLSEDGKYFNPCWVILGDSRIFSLSDGRWLKHFQEEKTATKKKSTYRRNNRYRVRSSFYDGSPLNREWLVCNYFRKRPNVTDKVELEVGHIYPYNEGKSTNFNNNMLNVMWQLKTDNRSSQRLFDSSKPEEAFKKEADTFNHEFGADETIMKMLTGVKEFNGNAGVEFHRDSNSGKITSIIPHYDFDGRRIKLISGKEKGTMPERLAPIATSKDSFNGFVYFVRDGAELLAEEQQS